MDQCSCEAKKECHAYRKGLCAYTANPDVFRVCKGRNDFLVKQGRKQLATDGPKLVLQESSA